MIFLHRRHSIQPFTKGLPSGQILDFLTSVLEPDAGALFLPILRMACCLTAKAFFVFIKRSWK